MFRVVSSHAARCGFSTSCPRAQFRFCRLVSGGISPLGHVSGTQMPGSVGSSRRRERVVVMTAMAVAASDLRSAVAESVSVDEVTSEVQVRRLSRGQTAAVVLSMDLGVMMAGYGLAGSYLTISVQAERHDVPLAWLVPAGIDGGLVAVVVLDLVLTWIGSPVGWLRQLVRVLSVGTVVVNVIAGWPDPVAVGLHGAAPLMLLAMLEASRGVLLRQIGEARSIRRELIPLIRWLLAPWRTLLLWRRMALWQITSYRTAIDTELQLRRAITLLQVRYGRRWRRQAPADLVWMLRTGVDVGEACEEVRALVGVDLEPAVTSGSRSPRGAVHSEGAVSEVSRMRVLASDSSSADAADLPPREDEVDGRLDEALQLNRRHWIEMGRQISAETLRKVSTSAPRPRVTLPELFEQQIGPQYWAVDP
jgi:hypothetical protein